MMARRRKTVLVGDHLRFTPPADVQDDAIHRLLREQFNRQPQTPIQNMEASTGPSTHSARRRLSNTQNVLNDAYNATAYRNHETIHVNTTHLAHSSSSPSSSSTLAEPPIGPSTSSESTRMENLYNSNSHTSLPSSSTSKRAKILSQNKKTNQTSTIHSFRT